MINDKQSKRSMTINEIEELSKSSTVCIYGAGTVAKGMAERLVEILDININFFCDRNPEKWGKDVISGIKCISPDELRRIEDVICFVLVGQHFINSVMDELSNYTNIKYLISYDDVINWDRIIDGILNKNIQIRKAGITRRFREADIYKVSNMHGKKIAVYTCITGGYDGIQQPLDVGDECDYYCITDNMNDYGGQYTLINARDVIPSFIDDNTKRNRYCKLLGNYLFSEYDYSVYVDGNVKIVGDIHEYIRNMNIYGFMSHAHAYEDCIYSEAIRVIVNKRDDEEIVISQMQKYKNEGLPRHYGMLHNAILVRKNNSSLCKSLMMDWWNEVWSYSKRDQLSLTYCMWKLGIPPEQCGTLGPNMRANTNFSWVSRHI